MRGSVKKSFLRSLDSTQPSANRRIFNSCYSMRWSYPSLLMSRIEHCDYLSSCFLTDHYIIVKTGYHATKLISIKLVPNLCTKIYNSAYRYAMSNPVNTALLVNISNELIRESHCLLAAYTNYSRKLQGKILQLQELHKIVFSSVEISYC